MDGQNNMYQPGADLPRPQYEAADKIVPENPAIQSETAGTAAEQPLTGQNPVPKGVSALAPVAAPPLGQDTPPASAASPISPALADDSDLIEQEWVSKAKAIVESTRDNPHAQNQE